MLFDAVAAPLALLAVALPFLFAVTDPPVANFWPVVAAWVCGAVLLLVGASAAPARHSRWWAGVLAGVVVGVVLSLGWLVYVATRPPMPLLGRSGDTHVFRDLEEHPDGATLPGVAVLRFDGGLFFATSEALENRARGIVDGDAGLTTLVLDFEGVNFADAQGAAAVREVHDLLAAEGVALHIARAKPQVLRVLEADGALAHIGAANVHPSLHLAVETQRRDAPTAGVT